MERERKEQEDLEKSYLAAQRKEEEQLRKKNEEIDRLMSKQRELINVERQRLMDERAADMKLSDAQRESLEAAEKAIQA